ncbi:DUF2281 domain-containing protein [Olivibacter sp. XZL3]|uniref:type II toxin-antitoxin system VapB family antitoxin n=1 Tax=Olivibacter sp. XZL3 TaxID=1735116 RepID=UPI001066715B|nr:DUF2281 domain-containing protein [Olivibacter sp. XZL3]
MDNRLLYSKLESLPEHMRAEVADFIDFLVTKAQKNRERPQQQKVPKFGSAKGMFKMRDDFDEPLEDFKEYT